MIIIASYQRLFFCFGFSFSARGLAQGVAFAGRAPYHWAASWHRRIMAQPVLLSMFKYSLNDLTRFCLRFVKSKLKIAGTVVQRQRMCLANVKPCIQSQVPEDRKVCWTHECDWHLKLLHLWNYEHSMSNVIFHFISKKFLFSCSYNNIIWKFPLQLLIYNLNL